MVSLLWAESMLNPAFDRTKLSTPLPFDLQSWTSQSRKCPKRTTYALTNKLRNYRRKVARPVGFEPPTNGFGSHYSIRLSYERVV